MRSHGEKLANATAEVFVPEHWQAWSWQFDMSPFAVGGQDGGREMGVKDARRSRHAAKRMSLIRVSSSRRNWRRQRTAVAQRRSIKPEFVEVRDPWSEPERDAGDGV